MTELRARPRGPCPGGCGAGAAGAGGVGLWNRMADSLGVEGGSSPDRGYQGLESVHPWHWQRAIVVGQGHSGQGQVWRGGHCAGGRDASLHSRCFIWVISSSPAKWFSRRQCRSCSEKYMRENQKVFPSSLSLMPAAFAPRPCPAQCLCAGPAAGHRVLLPVWPWGSPRARPPTGSSAEPQTAVPGKALAVTAWCLGLAPSTEGSRRPASRPRLPCIVLGLFAVASGSWEMLANAFHHCLVDSVLRAPVVTGRVRGPCCMQHTCQNWVRISHLPVEQPRGTADGVLSHSPGRALVPVGCCEGLCLNTAPHLEPNLMKVPKASQSA